MKERVRLGKEYRYWCLTTAKVVVRTNGFDPKNKSFEEISKARYRELQERGYKVGRMKFGPDRTVQPGWWILY